MRIIREWVNKCDQLLEKKIDGKNVIALFN